MYVKIKAECKVYSLLIMSSNGPTIHFCLLDQHVTSQSVLASCWTLSWSEHIDNIVLKIGKGIAWKCLSYVTISGLSQVVQ